LNELPRRSEQEDLRLWLVWYWGWRDPQAWRFDVDVEISCYPWPSARDSVELYDFRKYRSILDHFARPRLILPTQGSTDFREDSIALLALFAAKAQCLHPDDSLALHFRKYCSQSFFHYFEKQCRRRTAGRHGLSVSAWDAVVDRVFERLYHGKKGQGFTMPSRPDSFRVYVKRALQGESASAWTPTRAKSWSGTFPPTIDQAAVKLGVGGMTVRRCMKRLKLSEWTREAWESVSVEISIKKSWQEVTRQLMERGYKPEAARKTVQRWKKRKLAPEEARQKMENRHLRGTCCICEEEQAAGEYYLGRFLCAECLAEKLGESGVEISP
jgi:hypothetical protein